MASDSVILQSALGIAQRGWPVFPCTLDKSPYVKGGFTAATTNADKIIAWWQQFPDAMIGVPTGPATGMFVIDLDKRPDADGVEEWQKLCDGRAIPDTLVAMTPSGGQHIYFAMLAHGSVRNSTGRLGPRIDVRGDGGYVIVPPSRSAAGEYAWKVSSADFTSALPPAPDWLLDLLDPTGSAPRPMQAQAKSRGVDFRSKTALRTDIEAALLTIPNADMDWESWNNVGLAIFAASEGGAFDLFDRWSAKSSKYAASVTQERWEHYGTSPPTRCGAGTLFYMARQADPAWRAPSWLHAPGAVAAPSDGRARIPALEKSEDAFALSFAQENEAKLKFDHTRRAWYRWTGDCWALDENDHAFDRVRAHLRELAQSDPGTKSLGRIRTAREVERAAQADRRLAVDHKAWNLDPWLLGVKGGIVDLRSGKVMAPDPSLMINQQTLVAPADRGAVHPQWSLFLDQVTGGDIELQRYLQRMAGHFLTGDTSEEALFFVYGPGGNGKGTYLRAIAEICGNYARAAASTTFMATQHDRHLTELARLQGARLVTASETEEGRTWALARLKELTGNERPITANFMRRDHFEFMPTFKIIIVGNAKPKIENVDDAIRRRLHVIPFTQVPPAPDQLLKERLKAEYPAILRWMIDGCLDWQRDRLGRPHAVEMETKQYLSEEDVVGQWRQECCDEDRIACVSIAKLYGSYEEWCERNQEEAFTKRRFTAALRRGGCTDSHDVHANRALRGLRLKQQTTVAFD